MGLQYRAIRAAATVLLAAAAVGTGGMAGMTSALAADPATVTLSGTVIDGGGVPVAGVHLVISEELPPDGGLAAFQATTAADGSFSVDVYAWGTAEAPVSLTLATTPDEELQVRHENCSQTWSVEVRSSQTLALADAAPEPLALTATTTLLGEVCGIATGTPPPTRGTGGSQAGRTPPPTDIVPASLRADAGSERHAPALTIGFAIGLLLAGLLLLPRPGARRRD